MYGEHRSSDLLQPGIWSTTNFTEELGTKELFKGSLFLLEFQI